MKIVGLEIAALEPRGVHTIDVWFSDKRRTWIVERLDADGDQIGLTATFTDEADAAVCVAHWLRAHGDTQLVASPFFRRLTRKAASSGRLDRNAA